ncbi:MAG TPA: GNAT family N-acetyltransferase [Pseudonocardiaceae bacterium]
MALASVRPAVEQDIPHIARIHVDTWQLAYADLLPPDVLAGLDVEDAWAEALTSGAAKLFVAVEGDWTVGFCVAGPAPEAELVDANGQLPADAERVALISTLLVEPRWGRRGHGGRLLATAAAALREDGATRGVAWIPEADQASRKFYARIGWLADGTARTLDAGGRPLREIRLSGTLNLTLVD